MHLITFCNHFLWDTHAGIHSHASACKHFPTRICPSSHSIGHGFARVGTRASRGVLWESPAHFCAYAPGHVLLGWCYIRGCACRCLFIHPCIRGLAAVLCARLPISTFMYVGTFCGVVRALVLVHAFPAGLIMYPSCPFKYALMHLCILRGIARALRFFCTCVWGGPHIPTFFSPASAPFVRSLCGEVVSHLAN